MVADENTGHVHQASGLGATVLRWKESGRGEVGRRERDEQEYGQARAPDIP